MALKYIPLSIHPLGPYSVQSIGAAQAVSWAIGHNPGWVTTSTQDTSKPELILPTSEGCQAESTRPGLMNYVHPDPQHHYLPKPQSTIRCRINQNVKLQCLRPKESHFDPVVWFISHNKTCLTPDYVVSYIDYHHKHVLEVKHHHFLPNTNHIVLDSQKGGYQMLLSLVHLRSSDSAIYCCAEVHHTKQRHVMKTRKHSSPFNYSFTLLSIVELEILAENGTDFSEMCQDINIDNDIRDIAIVLLVIIILVTVPVVLFTTCRMGKGRARRAASEMTDMPRSPEVMSPESLQVFGFPDYNSPPTPRPHVIGHEEEELCVEEDHMLVNSLSRLQLLEN
uniref:Ig-like domain-containing protein n=2 Tax=Eptatretus burgeri TaxID=7764 RepID=A0A8C4N7N1_EPTBU